MCLYSTVVCIELGVPVFQESESESDERMEVDDSVGEDAADGGRQHNVPRKKRVNIICAKYKLM